MNIRELKLHHVLGCEDVHLKFPENNSRNGVYVVQSMEKCDIIALAIQLIYSHKYANLSSLHALHNRLIGGRITIKFQMPSTNVENISDSDSDQPSTSQYARERLQRRKNRRIARMGYFLLEATRDFHRNPEMIIYSVNNGDIKECTVRSFQTNFFSCTEILLPQLSNCAYEEYKNGKWVDILFNDNSQHIRGDNILKEFCELYRCHKIQISDVLSQIATSIMEVRTSLEMSLTAFVLRMFDDIRQVFEYITFSDYTAWFLFKQDPYLSDKFSFDDMQTYVQLRTSGEENPRIPWNTAEIHIQELLLVAIQIGFAYHSKQDVIFLQNLEYVRKQEILEIFNAALIQDTEYYKQVWQPKKYTQRIIDVCNKTSLTAILEFHGNMAFPIQSAISMKCYRRKCSTKWNVITKADNELEPWSLEIFSKIIFDALY